MKSMAERPQILRVLIASPGDVGVERAIIEDLIQEFNDTWAGATGIHLEPLMWERHSTPAPGSDAQAVINAQLGKFDILIGVFWTRIGTATPRAISGSVEEVEEAWKRYDNDSSTVYYGMFFSRAEIDPGSIDPKQLSEVIKLKEASKRRGLYKDYSDVDDFEKVCRRFLAKATQDYNVTWGPKVASTTPATEEIKDMKTSDTEGAETIDEEPEQGIWDLNDDAETHMRKATQSAEDFGTYVEDFNIKINKLNDDLVKAGEEGDQGYARQLIAKLASLLNEYGENVATFDSSMRESLGEALSIYENMADWLRRYPTFMKDDDRYASTRRMNKMRLSLEGFMEGQASLIKTIAALPPLTRDVAAAKKILLKRLQSLVSGMEARQKQIQKLEKAISP